MSAHSRRAGGPEKLWNRFHTQTPRLQISHFSPFTKTYFFLQRQHPANCILPTSLPPENEFGGSSRVLYTFCSSRGFNLSSYFLGVLMPGVVEASWRCRRGIKPLCRFLINQVFGPPVKEAHVNTFHSKPHLILPCAHRASPALTVQKPA